MTATLIGLLLPLNRVPSDKVPLHGPVPVTAMLNVALLPAHIVCVPLITPVGLGLTDTIVAADGAEGHPLVVTTTVYEPAVVAEKV